MMKPIMTVCWYTLRNLAALCHIWFSFLFASSYCHILKVNLNLKHVWTLFRQLPAITLTRNVLSPEWFQFVEESWTESSVKWRCREQSSSVVTTYISLRNTVVSKRDIETWASIAHHVSVILNLEMLLQLENADHYPKPSNSTYWK